LPNFFEGGTEALRGTESTKAERGIVALLDSSMILFDAAIHTNAHSMEYF
jgi:hypothetical protein